MNMLLGARTTIAAAVDAFFNQVTLLLPGDGTNGAQNNTFLDSSTNNFTITRNGNTTQGTFSPFSQTGWSNYFDRGRLTTTLTGKSAGTGSVTYELFFFASIRNAAVSNSSSLFNTRGSATGSDGIDCYVKSTGAIEITTSGAVLFTSTATTVVGQWYHLAVVRNGTTNWTVYLDGTSIGTFSDSRNLSSVDLRLADQGGSDFMRGYISNFRYTRAAVYTSSFTVPTAPLSVISNTEFLTCASNRFNDLSANNFTVTPAVGNGTGPSVQPFSPFLPTIPYSAATVGGSGFFDGTGDYLIAPASTNAAFAFGTGDFSIELWTYLPSVSAYGRLFTSSANNSNMDFAGGGAITYFDGGSYSGGTLVANAWQHIVVTRQSGTLRTFLNGVMQANASNSTNLSTNSQYAFAAATNGANTTQQYMAGIRVVKGGIPSAYSTSSTTNGTQIFTPPTAPLTGSESLTAGSVSLLLNYTNAGITDATAKNALETVGNAQISTTQSKFGGSSMSFDGTNGTYLSVKGSSAVVPLDSGDFTIEFWIYFNTGAVASRILMDYRPLGTEGLYPTLFTDSSSQLTYYTNSANRIVGGALSATSWTHIALCRASGSTRLFINGTQSGSTYTDANSYLSATDRPFVGMSSRTANDGMFSGYIDDLRITRGFARYTANFTAPTAAFPTQ